MKQGKLKLLAILCGDGRCSKRRGKRNTMKSLATPLHCLYVYANHWKIITICHFCILKIKRKEISLKLGIFNYSIRQGPGNACIWRSGDRQLSFAHFDSET